MTLRKSYIVNTNRLLIFILILMSLVMDSDLCAVIAAAFWLWLPNIEALEFSIVKKVGVNDGK